MNECISELGFQIYGDYFQRPTVCRITDGPVRLRTEKNCVAFFCNSFNVTYFENAS